MSRKALSIRLFATLVFIFTYSIAAQAGSGGISIIPSDPTGTSTEDSSNSTDVPPVDQSDDSMPCLPSDHLFPADNDFGCDQTITYWRAIEKSVQRIPVVEIDLIFTEHQNNGDGTQKQRRTDIQYNHRSGDLMRFSHDQMNLDLATYNWVLQTAPTSQVDFSMYIRFEYDATTGPVGAQILDATDGVVLSEDYHFRCTDTYNCNTYWRPYSQLQWETYTWNASGNQPASSEVSVSPKPPYRDFSHVLLPWITGHQLAIP